MIERRVITYPQATLAGLEHPAFEAKGAKDGPHLALIGGIHGCEYSSIAAVTRVMTELDTSELAGTITAVPVVSMQSFQRRSPFIIPEDGKNLNRCFPGSYDGTYTEVLARSIFDTLITPADAVLDLHGGDMVEALEPFAIYEESEVEERAHGMAVAMGLPYVVRERRREEGLAGMTSSAAAAAGIPAVIAEAGGCGQLEESAVRMLAAGVRNVLKYLEMLPGEPAPPHPQLRNVGSFVWLYAKAGGWWEAAAPAGTEISDGDVLGRVRNLWGEELEEIRAPAPGVVLFVTTSPAVDDGGLLLGLGIELDTDA
jgi:predicted deacylase